MGIMVIQRIKSNHNKFLSLSKRVNNTDAALFAWVNSCCPNWMWYSLQDFAQKLGTRNKAGEGKLHTSDLRKVKIVE